MTLREALEITNKKLQQNINTVNWADREDIKLSDLRIEGFSASHWSCKERNTLEVEHNSEVYIKVKSKKVEVRGRYKNMSVSKVVVSEVMLHTNTDEKYLDMTSKEIYKDGFDKRQGLENAKQDDEENKLSEFENLLLESGVEPSTFRMLERKFKDLTFSNQMKIK